MLRLTMVEKMYTWDTCHGYQGGISKVSQSLNYQNHSRKAFSSLGEVRSNKLSAASVGSRWILIEKFNVVYV